MKDITYCEVRCSMMQCKRNQAHIPQGRLVSMANLEYTPLCLHIGDETCPDLLSLSQRNECISVDAYI